MRYNTEHYSVPYKFYEWRHCLYAAVFVLATVLAYPATAQGIKQGIKPINSKVYFGASVGLNNVGYDNSIAGLRRTDTEDDNGVGRIYLGFDIKPYIAVELEYGALVNGEVTYSNTAGNRVLGIDTETTAFGVFAVAKTVFAQTTVFYKVGIVSWDNDLSFNGTPISIDDSGYGFAYGGGVEGWVGSRVKLRGEYVVYDVGDFYAAEIITLNFGFSVHF